MFETNKEKKEKTMPTEWYPMLVVVLHLIYSSPLISMSQNWEEWQEEDENKTNYETKKKIGSKENLTVRMADTQYLTTITIDIKRRIVKQSI